MIMLIRRSNFDHFETESGRMIKDFTFLDKETVQIKLLTGDKISMIVLKKALLTLG